MKALCPAFHSYPPSRFGSLVLLLALAGAQQSLATILNGDFSAGDLKGWTASAVDASGNPVSPLINVVGIEGNSLAQLSTGSFLGGPFVSTLQTDLVVDAAAPILSLNFSLPVTMADPSGTGTSPFLDTFTVSLLNGGNKDLLLAVKSGPVADPFGTAPGPTALGPPTHPQLGFNFRADLSSLAGTPLTLFFDLSNQDDGFESTVRLDDVMFTSATKPVPERTPTGLLLLLGFIPLTLLRLLLRNNHRYEEPTVLDARAVFRG